MTTSSPHLKTTAQAVLSIFETNAVALLGILSVIAFSTAAAARPNVVLFLADDLGYNDLSSYREKHETGSEQPPTASTPYLDSLAAEGMRFTNFYSGAAVCSPSRAALLTGRNATRVGIYNWIPYNSPMHLRDEEITIAELLASSGYRCGHFGKWHLTSGGRDQPLPQDQGFEHTFYTHNNAHPSHRNPENFNLNGQPVGPRSGYSCQIVVDEALAWLDDARSEGEPFFLNVWFNEPHAKVAAPEELASRHSYHPEYYGCIENMDLAVGRVLAYLEEHGLSEQTIVLFTSDNGSQVASSNLPLRSEKCFNFEGGIRVPFIARWPGQIAAGTENDSVSGFVDVLPTLCAKLDVSLPESVALDGENLEAALFASKKRQRSAPLFFFRYFHDPVTMIRDGDHVLLGFEKPMPFQENYDPVEQANLKPRPDEPQWSAWDFSEKHQRYLEQCVPLHFELYDLSQDIAQRHDIAAAHPETVETLKRETLRLRQQMIDEAGSWFDD